MLLSVIISRNALLLGLFAALATAVIAGTYLGTRHNIAENQRLAAERALIEIIPRERHDNAMLDDNVSVDDSKLLGLRAPDNAHIARLQGEPVAVILPATARDGYTDDIHLIIGINVDGSIAGVRVLGHRETPGLGDTVERKKSNWVDGFVGRSLTDPGPEGWAVRKDGGDFDQFTGATITPRAVVNAVHRALEYFRLHRAELLGLTPEEKTRG